MQVARLFDVFFGVSGLVFRRYAREGKGEKKKTADIIRLMSSAKEEQL